MTRDVLEDDLRAIGPLWTQPGSRKMVYHYTASAGLMGILKNEELFFTDSDFLNDRSEKKLVLSAFESVLEDASVELEDAFALALQQGYHNSIETLSADRTHYVFSASCNPDSLPMWNYYAKGAAFEGYNIGFDPFALAGRLRCRSISCLFGRVLYDTSEMKRRIVILLSNCNALWTRYSGARRRERIRAFALESLVHMAVFCKKECFCNEEEYRFAVPMPRDADAALDFRTVRGCLIPYIRVKYGDESPSTLIRSINISPLFGSELYRAGVERLLNKLGYDPDSVSVSTSAIPLRY